MIEHALVIGLSGRILAEALHDAGIRVDVFDCFGDQDTRAVADQFDLLPYPIRKTGYPEIIERVRRWRRVYPHGAIVPVSGFEAHPALVEELSRFSLWCGVDAESLGALKDPRTIHPRLADIPCQIPETSFNPPSDEGWIKKTLGQSGGVCGEGLAYWQRIIPGHTYSLLFFAEEGSMTALSVHEVLTAPTLDAPFRLGGCLMNPKIPEIVRTRLTAVAQSLCAAYPLRGLMGIDIQWDGRQCHLLDINPRPTAPLALFPKALRSALARRHLDSFLSKNKKEFPDWAHFPGDLNPAFAFVYAGAPLLIPADFQFPADSKDIPCLPAAIPKGMPVCTVQVTEGGLGELRHRIGVLREYLRPVAGQVLLESL